MSERVPGKRKVPRRGNRHPASDSSQQGAARAAGKPRRKARAARAGKVTEAGRGDRGILQGVSAPASSPIQPVAEPTAESLVELGAAAIDGAAAQPDDQAHPGERIEEVPVAIDWEAEARDIGDFAFSAFAGLYPSLEKVFTDEARARIYRAGGRLMQKYGVTGDDLLGEWMPEIMFAAAVAPLIPRAVAAVKHDRALQAQAEQDAAAPAAPPATEVHQPMPKDDQAPPEASPMSRFPM